MDGHASHELTLRHQRRSVRVALPRSVRVALPRIETLLRHQQLRAAAAGDRPHLRQDQTSSYSPALSESSEITTTPSSSGRDSIVSISSSGPARMQTSYKPQAIPTSQLRATKSARDTSSAAGPSRPARTSRYLREADRRDILLRIVNGERQSSLAKEFQVSRAAISNIKQRRNRKQELLLQQRVDSSDHDESGEHYEEETTVREGEESDCSQVNALQVSYRVRVAPEPTFFKHESCQRTEGHSEYELQQPVRHRAYHHTNVFASRSDTGSPSSVPSQPALSIVQSLPIETQQQCAKVTTPSMKLLLTRMVDQLTDVRAFQVAASRIARLLLEHALSIFPTQAVRIPVTSTASDSPSSYYLGTEAVRRTCAVTVFEATGGGEDSAPVLLQEFQAIEPRSGFGFVAPRPAGDGYDVRVPRNIYERNVLLLVEVLDAQSSHHTAKAVQAILQCGVPQQHIVLVALWSEKRALAHVLEALPEVRVVSSKVFAQDGDPMSEMLRSRLRP